MGASPTINSPQSSFASLETVMNLVRSLVNDTQAGLTSTPGEGQIITDNSSVSPFTLPFLNSAIRQLYRELRNVGDPQLVFDNVLILGLPPLHSPTNGIGGSDPTVQTILSTAGYFDGVVQWPQYLLPANMIYPTKLWERETGTNDNFEPMHQVQDGLPAQQQNFVLGKWEWRNNNLNFMGATQARDIRMRYYGALPQFFSPTMDFSSTYVPIQDSTDALAYMVAVMYARMLGSPGLADLIVEQKNQMFQLKNATTRRAQSINYHRHPFGNSSGDINSEFTYGSW
jgi:hypothetical protein